MYVPEVFAEQDQGRIEALMAAYGFALVVTTDADGQPFASHLPLIYEAGRGPYGTLLGHMARGNPQWRQFEGGAEVLVAAVPYPVQGHPMLPLVQATWSPDAAAGCDTLVDDGNAGARRLLELLVETASRRYSPAADRIGNVDFQISRGATGVSM